MDRKWFLKCVLFSFLFFHFLGIHQFSIAGREQEKDPIGNTQSGVVPVTKELLTREGELGPASPTFKMDDTSRFLVKKPYEEVEKYMIGEVAESEGESTDTLWDDWFLGEEENRSTFTSESSEPIDKK